MSQVILVNENDEEIGVMDKLEAHQKGLRHRAFSIFIFNSKGELLLQRRAEDKYHSPGLWTNTCCSHPSPGEDTLVAANRRLKEEMNLSSELKHLFTFHYQAEFENQMIENEVDHVFVGKSDQSPELNRQEADKWKYMNIEDLKSELLTYPERFTVWFRLCFEDLVRNMNQAS